MVKDDKKNSEDVLEGGKSLYILMEKKEFCCLNGGILGIVFKTRRDRNLQREKKKRFWKKKGFDFKLMLPAFELAHTKTHH